MSTERPVATLGTNGRHAVGLRLRLLEERLATVRRLLLEDEEGRLYRRRRPSMTADREARMLALMDETVAEITAAAERWHIPRVEQDAAAKMGGILAIAWQGIGEALASNLRGFGEVDPMLAAELDPVIERLMDLILELERTLSGPADETAIPSF